MIQLLQQTQEIMEKNSKKDTGSNEAWKANNIYDIAGNCWEWTQEAFGTSNRAGRGGGYNFSGSRLPAANRGNVNPTGSDYGKRFPSHFNNYNWHLERENQWKKI